MNEFIINPCIGGGSGVVSYKEDPAQRHIARVRRSVAARDLLHASEGKYAGDVFECNTCE